MPQSDLHRVISHVPGNAPAASMPLGNGAIGLNAWAESNGDVVFYIGTTDAWSEAGRLLKSARARITLSPAPAEEGAAFLQELQTDTGTLLISWHSPLSGRTVIKLWVDANGPYIHAELASDVPRSCSATLELWRNDVNELQGRELDCANLSRSPDPVYESADVMLDLPEDGIVWYHRNDHSVWLDILTHQGLRAVADGGMQDPLLHRMFGGMMRSPGMRRVQPSAIATPEPVREAKLSVAMLTAIAPEGQQAWVDRLRLLSSQAAASRIEDAYRAHCEWWGRFWERSRLLVSGSEEASTVARGYLLQRYMNACAGRGDYPIKFNGSIFTFDVEYDDGYDFQVSANADYRRWGAGYWFQNTRLPYWSMLHAGDYELMKPLFRMYIEALPLAKTRARLYFGCEGAYYPETMSFFGAYIQPDYGWEREGKPVSHIDNSYIRHYVQNNIELCFLMVRYYEHSSDTSYFREQLLPFIAEVLAFFETRYAIGEDGKLRLEPAQALENWHEAVNPLPDIAGLHTVLERLLALPEGLIGNGPRRRWERLLAKLPAIPLETREGVRQFAPAEAVSGEIRNSENVELYAVFPYPIAAVGNPSCGLGLAAFANRLFQETGGWRQDAIQAACLGLTEEAREYVVRNFGMHFEQAHFPAFWGPNFDWMPDQDHGSVASIALQAMLMQTDGRRIHLFPAWPEEWDVRFKLHAPYGTVVEGTFRDGRMTELTVTPAERMRDVEIGAERRSWTGIGGECDA